MPEEERMTFDFLNEKGKEHGYPYIKDKKSFDALISEQPMEGLLYDLNILPEVISVFGKNKVQYVAETQWMIMLTIIRLREIMEETKNDLTKKLQGVIIRSRKR